MTSPRETAIRWVLALLDDSGRELGPSDGEAIDWQGVVAFASAHMVLAALAPRIGRAEVKPPDDVAAFLEGIHDANAARNASLAGALCEIGSRFQDLSARPVVLKGGAFLLTSGAAASWRFMSDLDLLVAGDDLDDAVGIMRELGYRRVDKPYDPVQDAHAPAMISPCGTFSVELHTRAFDRDAYGLTNERLRGAGTVAVCGLAVPSLAARVHHAIAHAQLHNRQMVSERLLLKDVLDLKALGRELPLDAAYLDDTFDGVRARRAAGALVAGYQMVTGRTGYSARPDELAWARRAFARLSWPRWRQQAVSPLDMVRLEWFRWRHEPGHLARRFALIKDPVRLARVGQAWAYKQRQRLWA